MSEFKIDTALAFDVGKQAAIVGWCMRDRLFAIQCMSAVQPEWFSSPNMVKVYGAIKAIWSEFHRIPSPAEVRDWRPFKQEEARVKTKIDEAIVDALKKTEVYGLDMLRAEMTAWMHAVIFAQAVQGAVTSYNAKKVAEAWETIQSAALMKATSSFEEGTCQGFGASSDRIVSERVERMEQSTRIMAYGITYLDDALGGITPNDLVLIGAEPGSGKTQAVTSVALTNASLCGDGEGVYFFALEAENDEIERRIKYGHLAGVYYDRNRGKPDARPISYKLWRMGRIDDIMRPIEEELAPDLRKLVKNLHTLYRTSGEFNLAALERNLLDVVRKARLIIIDHLHYVDVDSTDENGAYGRIIKTIRDIVLKYSVPVIVIVHLRKKQGPVKFQSVMPRLDEIHGTSNVPKVATTSIMLARADDHVGAEPWMFPTYMAALKSRIDGSVTRYVGLTTFDSRLSKYTEDYRIGKVSGGEWEELVSKVPYWSSARPADVTSGHSI